MVLINLLANAQSGRYFDITVDTMTKQSTTTASGMFQVKPSTTSTTPVFKADSNTNMVEVYSMFKFDNKISSGSTPTGLCILGWDYRPTAQTVMGWKPLW